MEYLDECRRTVSQSGEEMTVSWTRMVAAEMEKSESILGTT